MRLSFPHPLLVCIGHVCMCGKVSIGGGMVMVMYGHHVEQEYGSTGSGCQSYSWSAGQEKTIFPCPRLQLRIWSRETGSAVPSRVSLLILHTQAESGAYSRDSHTFRGGVNLFIPPTAIGSVPSLSSHKITYRWRSLSRVRRHRAERPQGSSNNGCCLFRFHNGPFFCASLFPHPLLVCSGRISGTRNI